MSEEAADTEEVPVTGLEIKPSELEQLVHDGDPAIIDVRRDYEFQAGHIEGARHIEINDLPAATERIDKDSPVVFYCRGGSRSAMAAEAFGQAGFDARNLVGGITAWVADGQPIEPADGEVAGPRPV